jgi:hypothetical protein
MVVAKQAVICDIPVIHYGVLLETRLVAQKYKQITKINENKTQALCMLLQTLIEYRQTQKQRV